MRFMLTQSSGKHFTNDLKEQQQQQQQQNTGYSHLSESHSFPLLDFKTPSNSCSKMLYRSETK